MVIFRRLTAIFLQTALLALLVSGTGADCGAAEQHECAPDMATQCDHVLSCGPAVPGTRPHVPVSTDLAGSGNAFAGTREMVSVTRAPEPPPPRA